MSEAKYLNQTYDEERALYALRNATVENCTFAGPADGESVLKECRDIRVSDCRFSLRYPLWHAHGFTLERSELDGATRAPIWYSSDGVIRDCRVEGVKCLRECDRIAIEGGIYHSPEFGWRCRGLKMKWCEADSMYFLFESRDVEIEDLHMTGKYSFQYTENVHIRNSVLDTKDAFWHSRNVTVENSQVLGEYLGWFSEGLTLINCHIAGTQPLCYCKNLKLVNCTMENTDLSFEYSEVEADVTGDILSVKKPHAGHICADHIGQIILEDSVMENHCQIRERG